MCAINVGHPREFSHVQATAGKISCQPGPWLSADPECMLELAREPLMPDGVEGLGQVKEADTS